MTRGRTTALKKTSDGDVNTPSSAANNENSEDLLNFMKEITTIEKNVTRSKNQAVALTSLSVTAKHHHKSIAIVECFLQGLRNIGECSCHIYKTDD
jgi:hypothetical protein